MTTTAFRKIPIALTAAFGTFACLLPLSPPWAKNTSPTATSTEHERATPGLVRWHGDFDAACAAARTSGKPVLLFDLLGRLDDEFC